MVDVLSCQGCPKELTEKGVAAIEPAQGEEMTPHHRHQVRGEGGAEAGFPAFPPESKRPAGLATHKEDPTTRREADPRRRQADARKREADGFFGYLGLRRS